MFVCMNAYVYLSISLSLYIYIYIYIWAGVRGPESDGLRADVGRHSVEPKKGINIIIPLINLLLLILILLLLTYVLLLYLHYHMINTSTRI